MKKLLLITLIALSGNAFAEVYQCSNGSFSSKPCGNNAKTVGDSLNEQKREQDLALKQSEMERKRLQAIEDSRKQYKIKPSNTKSEKAVSQSISLDFSNCKARVLAVKAATNGTKYGAKTIVDSTDMYMAKVCTNDGSVLMTCSRLDKKLVTTRSNKC